MKNKISSVIIQKYAYEMPLPNNSGFVVSVNPIFTFKNQTKKI